MIVLATPSDATAIAAKATVLSRLSRRWNPSTILALIWPTSPTCKPIAWTLVLMLLMRSTRYDAGLDRTAEYIGPGAKIFFAVGSEPNTHEIVRCSN